MSKENIIMEYLEHTGVKGMKWGVRKGRSGRISAKSTLSRSDRKEQEFLDSPSKVYNKVYKKASGGIRKGTRALNANPKFKGKDFRNPSALRTEYYKEYSTMVTKQLNSAATSKSNPFSSKRIGMSPKKTLQMKFTFDSENELRAGYSIAKADTESGSKATRKKSKSDVSAGSVLNIVKNKLKHSDDDLLMEVELEFKLDPMGVILEQDAIKHVDIYSENFLSHFGVKGMRWGVRRSGAKSRSGGGKGSKGSSGPASEDHTTVSQLRGRSAKSLSNKELETLNKRMQLVQSNKNLNAQMNKKTKSAGRKMVEDVMTGIGKKLLTEAVESAVFPAVAKATKGKLDLTPKKKKPKPQS